MPFSLVTLMTSVAVLTFSTWPSGLSHTLLKLLLTHTRTATSVPSSW